MNDELGPDCGDCPFPNASPSSLLSIWYYPGPGLAGQDAPQYCDVGTCTTSDELESMPWLGCSSTTGDDPSIATPPRKRLAAAWPANAEATLLLSDGHVLEAIFGFFVGTESADEATVRAAQSVCTQWSSVLSGKSLWQHQPWEKAGSRALNWARFEHRGIRSEGTEGLCVECRDRVTGQVYALKKARVFPRGEGVPYYMLRELAVLRGLNHPNVVSLRAVSLRQHRLHLFFDFVPTTLHDCLNARARKATGDVGGETTGAAALQGSAVRRCRSGTGSSAAALPLRHVRRLMRQVLDAVAHIHGRGIIHRNLKPKHLLLQPGPLPDDPLEGAVLQLSDFALVRLTGPLPRTYTHEVVTLWYRSPEILMGARRYGGAVDIWSAGCVFSEMAHGRPPFTGQSEIDQLFQIFNALDTPTPESWLGFSQLPHHSHAFPNWRGRDSAKAFPATAKDPQALDLLMRMLTCDPAKRITALEALRHPFFAEGTTAGSGGSSDSQVVARRLPLQAAGSAITAAAAAVAPAAAALSPAAAAVLLAASEEAGVGAETVSAAFVEDTAEKFVAAAGIAPMATVMPEVSAATGLAAAAGPAAQEQGSLDGSLASDAVPAAAAAIPGPAAAPVWGNFAVGDEAELLQELGPEGQAMMGNTAAHAEPRDTTLLPLGGDSSDFGGNVESLELFWQHLCESEEAARADMTPLCSCRTGGDYCCQGSCGSDSSGGGFSARGNSGGTVRPAQQRPLMRLRAGLRATLVDWLAEIVEVFGMCERTLFLAVALIDRFLEKQPDLTRDRWQLLGATCLHLASKSEDVSYIGIEDLAHCADRLYRPRHVLEMEEEVLNVLDFDLAVPTVIDFLSADLVRRRGLAAAAGGRVSALAIYLAELTLQDEALAERAMPPSVVAASCLNRAQWILGLPLAPPSPLTSPAAAATKRGYGVPRYGVAVMRECARLLHSLHRFAPTAALQVVRRRHMKPERLVVAGIVSPAILEEDWVLQGQSLEISGGGAQGPANLQAPSS